MAYRAPNGRVPTPAGNGSHHRGSYAARLAVARTLESPPRSRQGGILLTVLLILLVGILAVISASIIAAGGAASVTLAALDKGLPDVRAFEQLGFAEPSVIYDRRGKVQLARFWEERRSVVDFDQIPPLILDATTAVEDDTYWENAGVDLAATMRAFVQDVTGTSERSGGSTITQQLVRARLLTKDLMAPGADIYLRKAKEIIQAAKLTAAFPGEDGKQRIITAYLNQIFYGNTANGVAAAASVFFGKKLNQVTPSEAALLAGLPQDPNELNPFKFATRERNKKGKKTGRLLVRTCAPYDVAADLTVTPRADCKEVEPVTRRNYILGRLAAGKGRWTSLTPEQLKAALNEPIVLHKEKPFYFKSPHFVWALRDELDVILADRDPLERGGYKIITTLDMRAQKIGEKYVSAAARLPNMNPADYYRALREQNLRRESSWLSYLRGANIRNAAMAAIDYRTGDILAYVGSAGYYRTPTPRFDPKYDHVGQAHRQPGSAWKPVVYATAIDQKVLTAGSVLLDITTPFARDWVPDDADHLERGPVLVRKALQYSLNIPAIRALHRVGPKVVSQYARKAGFTFINGPKHLEQANLAGAIGTVEVRLIDLLSAYGAFPNGGRVSEPRYILKVLDAKDNVIYQAGQPAQTQVWSEQTAYIISDILAGNTNPAENDWWGPRMQLTNGPGGSYRPAALKTGTTNDLRDYSTYGFLAPPRNKKDPALAWGVWMGNSDHSAPTTVRDIFATDGPGQVWKAFIRDYMRGKPVADFKPPKKGLVSQTIDAWSGGRPGPWTVSTVQEWFIQGTQPSLKRAVDKPGLLYSEGCGGYVVNPLNAENPRAPASWRSAVSDWMARARSGAYVRGRWGTSTAYFPGRIGWGGYVSTGGSSCAPPEETDKPPKGGGGGGGGGPTPTCKPGSFTEPPGCVVPTPPPEE